MIKVRKKKFNFENVEKYWFNNNKLMSHTMNALSLLFPQGERFFVDSVRNYRDMITDTEHKEDIRGFIGQEAMHSLQHLSMNNAIIDYGIEIEDIDAHLKVLLGIVYKLPKSHKLAITCGLEHITAMMASMLLERDDLRDQMTGEMQNLWVWHAIEESEHKGVAYDVFQTVSGSYPLRTIYLIISTVALIVFSTYVTYNLMSKDPEKSTISQNLHGLNKFFGINGAFSSLIPEWFTYFKPNFHPWDNDNSSTIEVFKKRFGI